ncbi:putative transglutaminase-like protein [Diplodia seriata]|uniref:Putative transglutaminase-like protein n=1 Tax=Diplodia seriata TaxID=420778 RepID=A0A0G2E218_9PEZI|nr:putative transglutaminase-like protein [Diplodia seriata]
MADDPAPMPSLKARIAALNLSETAGRPPPVYGQPAPVKKRPPPPPPANPPPRLSADDRSQSVNLPTQSYAPTDARSIGNLPAESTPQQKRVLPPPSLGAATEARPSLPPLPLGSRPDLAALQVSKPRSGALNSCLKCRDFRGVDAHAARFPREAIPSHDISWLAHQLTDPFPSLTDKARALFTWLHHNIDYNAAAFFNHNVQPSTPASTIATGLAVCEGYAGLFAALATAVGLESVVVGGHGKGFGHSPLTAGAAIPPFSCGHAWNAVRIDGGEWKLIDCCWGAGHIDGGTQAYTRKFSPECFTADNVEFGASHFPENPAYFFRNNPGRPSITWQEYIAAPPGANVYGFAQTAGLSKTAFLPDVRQIRIYDPDPAAAPVIRFQWEKRCPHFDGEALGEGKPYMFFLAIQGRDGRNKQFLPMNTDGRFWWLDVERVELGAPGQTIMACAGDKWHGGPEGSGRGVTREVWESDRYGFRNYQGIAVWDLA